MSKPKILLVGGGNMGRALLWGWIGAEAFSSVVVVEPTPIDPLKLLCGKMHAIVESVEKLNPKLEFDVVVLAVKPQNLDEALPALRVFARPQTVFLSIAAGKTVGTISSILGNDAKIVRAMPNTPAMISQGITVCFANPHAEKQHKDICGFLLSTVGEVLWIAEEETMHAVTALSGSGPAYVFALIEAMRDAGIKQGLDPKLAARLARQTVIGSAALAADRADKTPEDLRLQVTSRGGTTAAAMDVLLAEDGLKPLFEQALALAVQRSKMLG
jgi:pyrroline-5-carboxylate reductase